MPRFCFTDFNMTDLQEVGPVDVRKSPTFETLPPEMRQNVYDYTLDEAKSLALQYTYTPSLLERYFQLHQDLRSCRFEVRPEYTATGLFRTSKLISKESIDYFYRKNGFIAIRIDADLLATDHLLSFCRGIFPIYPRKLHTPTDHFPLIATFSTIGIGISRAIDFMITGENLANISNLISFFRRETARIQVSLQFQINWRYERHLALQNMLVTTVHHMKKCKAIDEILCQGDLGPKIQDSFRVVLSQADFLVQTQKVVIQAQHLTKAGDSFSTYAAWRVADVVSSQATVARLYKASRTIATMTAKLIVLLSSAQDAHVFFWDLSDRIAKRGNSDVSDVLYDGFLILGAGEALMRKHAKHQDGLILPAFDIINNSYNHMLWRLEEYARSTPYILEINALIQETKAIRTRYFISQGKKVMAMAKKRDYEAFLDQL